MEITLTVLSLKSEQLPYKPGGTIKKCVNRRQAVYPYYVEPEINKRKGDTTMGKSIIEAARPS
ncbi:MAG: hypothetical protein M0Z70_06305, partial [Nitrospiraceae bacterium]|nr:hypothetical protein [Nitrospirota bacterium]MDA8338895.1 hypothetical protein [Nitrospiraceae bacterium]